MINAASLHTDELDDIALACQSLKEQLDAKLPLLRYTVGIVQCDHEFIEAGILDTLYHSFGFPLVGGTTVATATSDAIGSLLFSMLVLTSDEVEFIVSHTEGLEEDYAGSISRSLRASIGSKEETIRMALIFPPIIETIANDNFIEAFETSCGNIPVFGTNPVDDKFPDYSHCLSISNDQALSREMSYMLLLGNVSPRFFVASVPPRAYLDAADAVITSAQDNIVYEINHMRVTQYMEGLGLMSTGTEMQGDSVLLPLLVSQDSQSRPFVRTLLLLRPDGAAVCSGNMPVGAQVVFGSNNAADVLATTTETVVNALSEEDIHAALIFSCIIRQLVIGIDLMKEFKQIQTFFPADVPYIASYSGGEFSPTDIDLEDKAQNRYHNYSLIMCLF